jgi:HK97 family phage major capsid protein
MHRIGTRYRSAMTATLPAPPAHDLRSKLKAIESDLAGLRTDRAELVRERDAAKAAFAAVPGYDTASPEFQRAERAVHALSAKDDAIEKAQQAQVGVLRLMGQAQDAEGGAASGEVAARLKAQPAAWLGAVLDRRKATVPTLDDATRMKALTVGQDVDTVSEGQALIDLLAPQSVAFAAGVQRIVIGTTETRIPRFTDLPDAGWVPELGAFPKSDVGLEMVTVRPDKAGLVTTLSIEAFADLRPEVMAGVQRQVLRAVALTVDAGLLFGDGTGATPRGLAHTSGIGAVSGALDGLGVFAQAAAALLASNARPGALILNPRDYGTLLALTEADGNRKPLLADGLGYVEGGGLKLPGLGVPLRLTPAAPQGTALMFDPGVVAGVIRQDADIALDPFYSLDTGEVGLRVNVRADVVVGQAVGAVLIDFTP